METSGKVTIIVSILTNWTQSHKSELTGVRDASSVAEGVLGLGVGLLAGVRLVAGVEGLAVSARREATLTAAAPDPYSPGEIAFHIFV